MVSWLSQVYVNQYDQTLIFFNDAALPKELSVLSSAMVVVN